ncbi:DNA polymerase III subunit delta [bacterium]|nr:DNA polymerase III subunit delta [bacterium]
MVDIVEQFKSKSLQDLESCYAFFGSNDYFSSLVINSLKQKLIEIGADQFDFWVSDAKNSSISEVINNAVSFPFISPKKIVIFKNIEVFDEDDFNMLQEYIVSPCASASVILLFTNKKQASSKVFKKNIAVFKLETDEKLAARVIKDLISGAGKKISSSVLDQLQKRLGNDIISVQNDVEKLIAYVGMRDTIEQKDVDSNFRQLDLHTIFNLIDDISSGNRKEAVHKLNNIMKSGTSAQEIIAMIYWNYKRIWSFYEMLDSGISESEVLEKIDIKSWAKSKFLSQAKKYDKNSLKKIFSLLFDIDIETRKKSGSANLLLEIFVLSI